MAVSITVQNRIDVSNLYVALFGRAPDGEGLGFWSTQLASGQTLTQVADTMFATAPARTYYPSFFTNQQIVDGFYTKVLGRTADAEGSAFWTAKLNATGATAGSVISEMISVVNAFVASTPALPTDAAAQLSKDLFVNKANVALYYGLTNGTVAGAQTALNGVDSTAASVTAAKAAIDGGAGTAGQTFTLATGLDTLTGTIGNDTFVADNTTGANAQTGAADTINGGNGTDTLKVFLAAAGAVDGFNMPGLTSVENVYINNGTLTNGATRDTSSLTGVTSVALDSPVAMLDGTAFTLKTAAGQALSLTKVIGTAGAATSTVNLNGASNVALNGVGTDVTLDLISTGAALTLSGTGAASTIVLANTGAKLATLTITGDKAITVSENIATLLKIDGSAATASVKVDTSAGTAPATLAFTGGSANDVLTQKGAAFVKTQVLDGGAGTADMLVISDANTTAFATIATGVNAAAKNFEVLGFGGTAAVTADVSLITAMNQFAVAGLINTNGAAGVGGVSSSPAGTAATAAVTFTNQVNTQSFIVGASISAVGGASTVAASGGANGGNGANGAIALNIAPLVDNGTNATTIVLNGVTLNSSGGAGAAGLGAGGNGGNGGDAAVTVSATSFETVNIISNGAATDTTTLTSNAFISNGGALGAAVGAATIGLVGNGAAGLAVGTNATVTITGASDLNTGFISGNNVTVSAGTFTGKLSVATANGNDTITGGSGVNLIILNGGVDTVDLGKSIAKADVITVASASGLDASAGKFVSITGFTSAATTGDNVDIAGTNLVRADIGTAAATGITNLFAVVTKGIVTFSGSAASTATLAQLVTAVYSAGVLNGAATTEVAFQYGTDTYVAVETGAAGYTAGTDTVVKLVGVTGLVELSATASAANVAFVG